MKATGAPLEPWHSATASERTWNRMFDSLLGYRRRYGHLFISRRHGNPELRSLGRWAGDQRVARNRGDLEQSRIDRLEAIGFPFDYHAERWEAQFARLKQFRDQYGDCHVPFHDSRWGNLSRWVQVQRRKYREGTLDVDRMNRLERVGFAWRLKPGRMTAVRVLRERPSVFLLKLASFRDEHGHIRVPTPYTNDEQLPLLLDLARRYARRGELAPEAVRLLLDWGESFGDNGDTALASQLAFIGGVGGFLQVLERFRKTYGHATLHARLGPPFTHLGIAGGIVDRELRERPGSLRPAHRRRLRALGFAFEADEDANLTPPFP